MVKMLMEIDPLQMRESMVMISPSRREVFLAEQLCRSPRLVLPRFRLMAAEFLPESLLMIFILGKNDLYNRRGAPEVGRGGHHPPGRAWASWRPQVGCAHLVAPLWYLFSPVFIKYSIKSPREVLAHLELCRIGSLT